MVVVMGSLSSAAAAACPDCSTAELVRARTFSSTFFTDLAMVALPLLVVVLISAVLYRIGDALAASDAPPQRRRRPR